ncbi:E3 ubiquitin-protein ligase Topors [Heterocephalus glaber]|uniref:RING-type E3 ubiquitin transferase n=1 Tax=Heterocephalus glaber TaxID=10181 RepID=G5B0G7_HETGA|nr:E3 ubiquitin-protein ligase Topors [Heterocephalus glaber]
MKSDPDPMLSKRDEPAFDQHVNYDCPAPAYEEGSHSDSSVITISSDETETQDLDINVATVRHHGIMKLQDQSSYSSSEQVRVAMTFLLNTSDSLDEELVTEGGSSQIQGVETNEDLNNDSNSSDNCVIVGFVKSLAERTPELVELSCDSEELGSYEKMEMIKTQEKAQSYSSGGSDVSRCSSRPAVLGKDEQINKGHCDSGTRIKSRRREMMSNEFLAPSLELLETKDIVTIEDEFGVLDKESDITTLNNNLNNASETVGNIPPQAASAEQTLDVREECTFASPLENQSINVSIQTEPSDHLPSPRTSLLSVSLGRDCDVLKWQSTS